MNDGQQPPGPPDPAASAPTMPRAAWPQPGTRPLTWPEQPTVPGQEMEPMTVAPKNPAVSVLLSLFIPGLGSMVNGNAGTGVTILALNLIGWMLAIVLIGIPLAIGTWIWGLVDAYQSAQRWNRAHGIIS
jgi:TM2 domain-containing membrane protein YozV